ncbi:MAG: B12-binding domain-containing radical SAM protein [Candidatus Micrarchaeia archaeon]
MAKFVLISDTSLTAPFRNFPLLQFLPSAPDAVPSPIYYFLKGKTYPALPNGEAKYAPYAVRKLEAALLKRFSRNDVVVAHQDYIEKFITDDTEVIGVSTMDPLGLGPLTMSYTVLLGLKGKPWVYIEWEKLIKRINAARKGKKAKLLVGGPGVWDFTVRPEELEREGIDYAFQGEADDIAADLFEQVATGNFNSDEFFNGYLFIDDNFRRTFVPHSRFLVRKQIYRTAPPIEEIPDIVRPSIMGLTEVMRGCGIGCDFCEVTLRPLRYYPVDKVQREISVNVAGGITNAWLHSDEIFGYKKLNAKFEPNEEALTELFQGVMSTPGVTRANPTHARVSIPAAYPELIEKLSKILKAGPDNWIGVQVGVETGSDRLALRHMPNKTLPLRIGPDGTWKDIVWLGTKNFNKYWWRPAYTVQVGQSEETDDDNWDTVALINQLSNSYVDGRPFEFTITPMQNVPMGMIKSRGFSNLQLTQAQLAVYYASYRHLAKMALRDAKTESKRNNPIARIGVTSTITLGGLLVLKLIESFAKKSHVDIEKAKRYGLNHETQKITELSEVEKLN